MCLCEEAQRSSEQKLKDACAICISVRSLIFELKVIKPGACRFDYIATQAVQRSAGMPENSCRTRRRQEAESFSKKQVKVTSVAWHPHVTQHYTLHYTLHCAQHYRTAGRGSILEL